MSQSDGDNASSILLWYDLKDCLHGAFCVYKQRYNEHKKFTTGLRTDFTHALAFSTLANCTLYADGVSKDTTTSSGASACTPTKTGLCLNESKYGNAPNALANTVIRAVRIYNRTLSADELAWNAMLDRHRFLGESLADATLGDRRVSDGVAEFRYDASTRDALRGTATVAGSAAGYDEPASGERWIAIDASATVTFAATPQKGYAFHCWTGDTNDLSAAQRTGASLTVSADAPRALCAEFVSADAVAYTGDAALISPTNYVQQNMTVQFDGVDNQGTGTHDSSATTWIDLKGHVKPWQLLNGANFSDRRHAFYAPATRSGSCVATNCASGYFSGYKTIEVATWPETTSSSTGSAVFRGGYWTSARNLILSGGSAWFTSYDSNPPVSCNWKRGTPFTVGAAYGAYSALNNSLRYGSMDGASALSTTSTGAYQWYSGTSNPDMGVSYGDDKNKKFIGSIYSMRFYSRPLEPEEFRRNAHLDQARFNFCGNVHVLGFPREVGAPSPGYGSHDYTTVSVPFSCGTLTAYDDNVSAVALGEGVRAKCRGYTLGEATTPVAATSVEVLFSDGMTLSWRWQVQYRVTLDGGGATWVDEGADYTLPTVSDGAVVGWSGACSEIRRDGTTAKFAVTRACDLKTLTATGTVRTWLGTAGTSANLAANWQDANGAAGLPETGDTVVLDATSKDHPLTWDLDGVTLQHWIQDGYTNLVTFKTGRTGTAKGKTQAAYGVEGEDGVKRLVLTGSAVVQTGVWTHPAQPALYKTDAPALDFQGVWRLVAQVGGDFTLGADAKIDVTGKGYDADSSVRYGAHAGTFFSSETGLPYGSAKRPTTIGSGANSVGGGSVELHVAGTANVDGPVCAQSASNTYRPGAGGAIWIEALALRGAGALDASASRHNSGGSSGGSGGRIALWVTGADEDFSRFTGTTTANGGGGCSFIGTVYRQTAADAGKGELVLDGTNFTAVNAENAAKVATEGVSMFAKERVGGTALGSDVAEDMAFRRILLTNCVVAAVWSNMTLKADEIVGGGYVKTEMVNLKGGTLVLPSAVTPTNVQLRAVYPGSVLRTGADGAGALNLYPGSEYVWDAFLKVEAAEMTVKRGATLRHSSANAAQRLDAYVTGDVTVEEGATVGGAGHGYAAKYGPGHPTETDYTARGGAHGGAAYDTAGVKPYGSIREPITHGSGGCEGAGGGALKLVADGTLTLNGTVNANGAGTKQSGAGGSVWFVATNLVGSGTITANGADGVTTAYDAGGGGRLALTVTDPEAKIADFAGTYSARGGRNNSKLGAANGTIYLRDGDQGPTAGRLVIDSGTLSVGVQLATEISEDVTETDVGSVLVTNCAALCVNRGKVLSVSGDFTKAATNELALGEISDGTLAGGTVQLVDATRTSTVTGTNRFANLTVATPGKSVRFGTAATSEATILPGGVFTVAGEAENLVTLRSTTDGAAWPLTVSDGATAAITYADVKDSDARGGLKVVADDTSVDSGSNQNWSFVTIRPGDEIVWYGGTSTDWGDPDNWRPVRTPVETDVVKIDATCDYFPSLTSAQKLNRLVISAGATLCLAGFDLTVTNGLSCAGTLDATAGASVITVAGGVSLAAFRCGESTLALAGTERQTVDFNGATLWNLTIDADATFTSGFTANRVTCTATSARDIAFAAGAQVRTTYATLTGVSDETPLLTLRGDGAWNLSVSSTAFVQGASVSNCVAAATLYAEKPCADLGGNVNWVFDVTATTWTGGASESKPQWTTAANWAGGVVPDASSRVVFSGAATVYVPEAGVKVRELDVDSAGGTVTLAAEAGKTNVLTTSVAIDVFKDGVLRLQNVWLASEGAAFVRAGGTLTHLGPVGTDAGYGVHLTAAGVITIEAGGTVSGYERGFSVYAGPAGGVGSGHGGSGNGKTCYGSVFAPVTLGSGGYFYGNGGGRVYLKAGGTLTLDGTVNVSTPPPSGSGAYAGSGGSAWITCGTLAGAGTVTANGGNKNGVLPGSGGRVAIYETAATDFAAFTGLVSAYGGATVGDGNKPEYPCGTIYLESAAEAGGRGTLTLDNQDSTVASGTTDLPATVQGDAAKRFKRTTAVVGRGATLKLTSDLEIAELELAKGGGLNLNGHVLRIRSRRHCDRTHVDALGGFKGDWEGTVSYGVAGSTIKWGTLGLSLSIR